MAMPRLAGTRSFTRSPPMKRSPSVMSSRPAMRRSSVDFPQPEGPTKTTNSPSWMSRSTPWMTFALPKDFRTFLRITSAIAQHPGLTLDRAGCKARHDLALEHEHQGDDRQGHDHGGRHDRAPGQLVGGRAGHEGDGGRHGAALVGEGEGEGEEKLVP